MNNILLMPDRPITHRELNSLTGQKDRLVVMAISRMIGRTDWSMNDMYPRGKWTTYPDGERVFSFDKKECFILYPVQYDRETNQWKQRYSWLFDIKDYEHHTAEDEKG